MAMSQKLRNYILTLSGVTEVDVDGFNFLPLESFFCTDWIPTKWQSKCNCDIQVDATFPIANASISLCEHKDCLTPFFHKN